MFPSDESLLRALALLLRSPAPCEALTGPLLALLPWHHLSRDAVLLALGELYHLHPLPAQQYAAMPEMKRMEQR